MGTTLDRMCAGCIYGRTPDAGMRKKAARFVAHLQPGDTHTCHRTEPFVGGTLPVCRGFIDRHKAGKGCDARPSESADAIDARWDAEQEKVRAYFK